MEANRTLSHYFNVIATMGIVPINEATTKSGKIIMSIKRMYSQYNPVLLKEAKIPIGSISLSYFPYARKFTITRQFKQGHHYSMENHTIKPKYYQTMLALYRRYKNAS